MINLQIFRFKKLHLHPVSWVPNNYHILRIIDRRLTFGGINLKSPVLTIPSALTSLSSYAQCLCKFIMNFIEGKVKYSGITKMELYVSFYGKFRPGWEWFIEITNYLHYLKSLLFQKVISFIFVEKLSN